ncbi:MAG: S8 family serine peptidase [Bdellovibrionales bacterium]|nr:S8 family serine peptidase [Bdellovibrionales bacterium]
MAGQELMVLVDTSCLGVNPSAHSKATQALLGPALTVQHKSFSDLKIAAVPVSAIQKLSATDVADVTAHPCVKGVSENPRFNITGLQMAPVDPRLGDQLFRPAIEVEGAERLFFHPLYGITQPATVAIVDTGVQASHPDLASRMWRGPNGEVGYDFFNGDGDPDDDNGHGTHVAGLVGAQKGNGIGGAGVMGEYSRLMAVKTQSKDGGGLLSDLVNGIRWAADKGADVINLSIAGTEDAPFLREAVEYALAKNVVVVVASGNNGQEIRADNLYTPVGYAKDYQGMIGVGAFDALSFQRPIFSNYSPTYVELSAPGAAGTAGIFSTFYQSRYIAIDGTSMAAPQVSAAAAMSIAFMKSNQRTLLPAEVEALIQQAAIQDSGLSTSFVGGRRLNVKRLGQLLLQSTVIDSSGGFDVP